MTKFSEVTKFFPDKNFLRLFFPDKVLVTEIYKVQNNCSPELMNKVFPINEPIYEYGLRNTTNFATSRIKTVRYGSESLSYLGLRLWNILLDEYKKSLAAKLYMRLLKITFRHY